MHTPAPPSDVIFTAAQTAADQIKLPFVCAPPPLVSRKFFGSRHTLESFHLFQVKISSVYHVNIVMLLNLKKQAGN